MYQLSYHARQRAHERCQDVHIRKDLAQANPPGPRILRALKRRCVSHGIRGAQCFLIGPANVVYVIDAEKRRVITLWRWNPQPQRWINTPQGVSPA